MRSFLAILSLVIVALAGTAFALPAAAAIACPYCYGFRELAPGLYVDHGALPAQRAATVTIIAEAEKRLGAFYGSRRSDPRIFICSNERCYGRFGGRSRGVAILDWAIFISPRGQSSTIITHELSHIEFHSRIGWLKTWDRVVPQWFDEGLAVVVSEDPRYLMQDTNGEDRCVLQPGGPLPGTREAWVENAAHNWLYARAACRVSRWIAAHGGPSAIVRLADDVAAGRDFAQASQ